MFWHKKQRKAGQDGAKNTPDREALKAQALENARAARARIGEEQLDKLGKILNEQMMKAEAQKARDQIRAMDKGHVADHIKTVLKDE
jgi:hypothetical protein